MTDIVDRDTRSRMMAGIKGKNTKPEILVRKLLHHRGFRYRLHVRDLPGKPDIVLRKYNAVIFVHGCFWHGHDCKLFKVPGTNSEFWVNKIRKNRINDRKARENLLAAGWRTGIIWECAIRGASTNLENVADTVCKWIMGNSPSIEVRS